MLHFGEELKEQAAAAFTRMQEAALAARLASARAELMRHMLIATTGKKHLPRDHAAAAVVDEWLNAWNQRREDWAKVVPQMTRLAAAFYDYAHDASEANDRTVRAAFAVLKAAHDDGQRTIEDQMAWLSERALPWWGRIRPLPAGVDANPRAAARPAELPFWE
jgi:hypothetical protein